MKKKKVIKTIGVLIVFLAVIPAVAGIVIATLWNAILTAACGFSEICFLQGAGLFLLGQFLTGGVVLGLFLIGGSVHHIHHHHNDWGSHWHGMTNEQRRTFIERRRMEHSEFRNRTNGNKDADK